MGIRSRLLLDQVTFTANTQTLNVPADNLIDLEFGTGVLQNGTDAPTLAGLLGVFDEVIVDLGGHNICKLRVDDLAAYNQIWLDNTPWFDLGGGDNYLALLAGLKLPLHITKNGRSVQSQWSFGTATPNADNQTISAEYRYRDSPFAAHFAYQYESKAGATQVRWDGLARIGSSLLGLLVFQPWTSVDDDPALPEIAGLSVRVDDREVYKWNVFTSKVHRMTDNSVDSAATWGDKIVNPGGNLSYQYIDFSMEPWRADRLTIITTNQCGAYNAGAAGTCRIVGVYAEL